MSSPSPPPEYCYVGSQKCDAEDLFPKTCALAWPYACYCARRYLHDPDAAYDLMDAAVANAEQYYMRFEGSRTPAQLLHRLLSVLKRLSKQAVKRRREVPSGLLLDLELLPQNLASKADVEQELYVAQMLARLTERSRLITYWRMEGYTWRQIADQLGADHTTVRRAYRRELRALFDVISESESQDEH